MVIALKNQDQIFYICSFVNMVGKSMVSVYLPVQCIVGVYLRISIIPLFYVKLRRNDLFDPDSVYRKVVSECLHAIKSYQNFHRHYSISSRFYLNIFLVKPSHNVKLKDCKFEL